MPVSTEDKAITSQTPLQMTRIKPLLTAGLFSLCSTAFAQTPSPSPANVTKAVQARVIDNRLSVNVDNSLTDDSDPAFGQVKKLKVSYTLDGKAETRVAAEGSTLKIAPSGKHKLVVTRAEYGDISTTAFDVTQAVQDAVHNDQLQIVADTGTLTHGNDPAPNQGKELKVEYEVGAKACSATVPEGESLHLPLPSDGKGKLVITSATYRAAP